MFRLREIMFGASSDHPSRVVCVGCASHHTKSINIVVLVSHMFKLKIINYERLLCNADAKAALQRLEADSGI